MANGINYSGSNKIIFTANNSTVLTLESGSGAQFTLPITASSINISSSDISSSIVITSKDVNSSSKLVFPISETASYFFESMSGSNLGDFRLGISASVAGGLNGIQDCYRLYAGGLRNFRKQSFFANNTESLTMDDSGNVSIGYTGSGGGWLYVDYPNRRIGIGTKTPSLSFDVNSGMIISGNVRITGSLSVGFNSAAATGSAGKNVIQVSGNVLPSGTLTHDLGSSSLSWNNLYVKDGIIQSSDRDLKTDIYPSDLGIDFINSLNPVSYKFTNGTSGRTHYGLIAQEIEQVLIQKNIDTKDFAGFIKNKYLVPITKQVTYEYVDANNTLQYETSSVIEMVEDNNKEYIYSLRYSEFISPMIKAIQQLNNKLLELENRLSSSR